MDYKSLQACRMDRNPKNTNGTRINCEALMKRASGVEACQRGPDGNEQICNMALQRNGYKRAEYVNPSNPTNKYISSHAP